jgi:solute carrier family 25 (mitochondrial carnitine/acylcarnitine transporter), member 20/29
MHGDCDANNVAVTEHFIAGIAAGTAEWFIGHPLDTIRIRVIAGTTANGGLPVAGTYQQLVRGFSSMKGISSLYRGSVSELLSAAIGGSLLFGVNNMLKRGFGVSALRQEKDNSISLGLVAAAGATGFFDALVYKPLEVIKLKMQVASEAPSSFIQFTKKFFRERGVAGLYRGLLPTLIRETIGSIAFFAAYEITKSRMMMIAAKRLSIFNTI